VRLTELAPQFLKIEEAGKLYRHVDTIDEADGLTFLCPKCFGTNSGNVGTHYVCCWLPRVPQTEKPTPGRWEMEGSGYGDLTLVAGSSSVLITSGCMAHFFVRSGGIEMCS
jgi:hypothetical protein